LRGGELSCTDLGFHLGIVHNGYDGAVKSVTTYNKTCKLVRPARSHSDQAEYNHTILDFADTGLEVIQGHIADLIFEIGEIHGEGCGGCQSRHVGEMMISAESRQ
jgi:hypothetical protein